MDVSRFVMWKKTFSVEHEALDGEHRKIIAALNRLYCLIKEENAGPAVRSVLQDLLHYTTLHCAHEEELMRKWGYEGYAEHFKTHERLIERTRLLADWSPSDDQEEHDLLRRIVSLNEWWVNHIQGPDHKYVPVMLSFNEDTERTEGRA